MVMETILTKDDDMVIDRLYSLGYIEFLPLSFLIIFFFGQSPAMSDWFLSTHQETN